MARGEDDSSASHIAFLNFSETATKPTIETVSWEGPAQKSRQSQALRRSIRAAQAIFSLCEYLKEAFRRKGKQKKDD